MKFMAKKDPAKAAGFCFTGAGLTLCLRFEYDCAFLFFTLGKPLAALSTSSCSWALPYLAFWAHRQIFVSIRKILAQSIDDTIYFFIRTQACKIMKASAANNHKLTIAIKLAHLVGRIDSPTEGSSGRQEKRNRDNTLSHPLSFTKPAHPVQKGMLSLFAKDLCRDWELQTRWPPALCVSL